MFEPFGGSGTTILAGQRTGRRVRAIELAPANVDLAIARWRMLHPDLPVTLADVGGYLAITSPKSASATDVTWSAETSGDLKSWSPAVITTNTSTAFAARDTVLKTGAAKRFIRLKIIRP